MKPLSDLIAYVYRLLALTKAILWEKRERVVTNKICNFWYIFDKLLVLNDEISTDNTNEMISGKDSADLNITFLSCCECWYEKTGTGLHIGRLRMAASIVL
jgi:hypothetical protein